MPRSRSNRGELSGTTPIAKRKCIPKRNGCYPWSETDETFLSNVKIDLFMDSNTSVSAALKESSPAVELHNASDDNLFGDIYLPESSESGGNLGSTQINLMIGNDTLFKELDLEELTSNEVDDIFSSESKDECADIRCTQQFLNDIAFKIPAVPARCPHQKDCQKTNLSTSFIQGSQYEIHENLQNQAVTNFALSEATFTNWESEPFTQVESYSFPSKGDFHGLPDKVRRMIFEHKGINALYEWQEECLGLPAIRRRKNLIYALPTSGGKTLVAEILMLREIICREKNVLFILPYVSIVQEKVCALAPFAIACDFIVDEYTSGKGKCPPTARKKRKSIFVASIEKGAILFDSLIDAQRANEIGLVVIDELHLIGEKGRGATLESFLTKVMFIDAGIQIVGMSATIGNLAEVSAFLKADVYTRGFRPVELKEYIKYGNDIMEINSAGQTVEEIFVHNRTVDFKYNSAVLNVDPDHLAGLVAECAPSNCCLVFCPTRRNCENVALLLSRVLPKSKFLEHRKNEKADLMDALDKVCGVLSTVLAKTIPFGIAYHHSGLTTDERRFIETAYRFGVLSVICCTSTLAAGVNLPAKRVIIRSPYVGVEFMTLCKYKQMVGRAGRAGMGDETGESILITPSRDSVRVKEMLFSPMDRAISSLNSEEGVALQNLILSAIGLDMATCRTELYRLIDSTLLAIQNELLEIRPHELVMDVLRTLFRNKILQVCDSKSDSIDILTSQDSGNQSILSKTQLIKKSDQRPLLIGKSTRFKLTEIGKAAFKAGIDYKRTYAVYNEIKMAQKNLILSNYSHLLYLIVCFMSNANGDELFAANASVLVNLYGKLNATTQALFQQLGFTEAHLAKIAKTLSIQGSFELKINRLYKTVILLDVLDVVPIPTIAENFNIERGMLQNLISHAAAAASALVRLCDQVPAFWCFQPLFERLIVKFDRCGTAELEPLLDLPAVKMNRAKQLYAAGFKTVEDIAKSHPMHLMNSIEHMPLRIAKEIISAAKIILIKKLDHLEEETEALKICLKPDEGAII